MTRKEIILPTIAVVGGLAGFGLRKWELSTAFEPDTGLVIAGMPATWALILFSLVIAVGLAVLCRGPHNALTGYDQAFGAKGNTLYMAAMAAAALLLAGSGMLTLLALPDAYQAALFSSEAGNPLFTILPRLLLGALSMGSAWCLLCVGKNNYRGEGHGKYNAALLVPAFTCCIWLIVSYQARSGDPVILDYAWQLFAIIASVLGTYFMAGFAFEHAKVFRASWSMLVGVYFCLVTLADRHAPAMLLLYAALLLYLLASAAALLCNAGRTVLSTETTRESTNDWEEIPDGE